MDVSGDLAKRDRVTFDSLDVDCAVRLYSTDVFANHDAGLFFGNIFRPAPTHGFLPAVGAKFQIKFPRFDRSLRLVRRSKIHPRTAASMLDLHAVSARIRFVKRDLFLPITDIRFGKMIGVIRLLFSKVTGIT
jgi:hypothetical protein